MLETVRDRLTISKQRKVNPSYSCNGDIELGARESVVFLHGDEWSSVTSGASKLSRSHDHQNVEYELEPPTAQPLYIRIDDGRQPSRFASTHHAVRHRVPCHV